MDGQVMVAREHPAGVEARVDQVVIAHSERADGAVVPEPAVLQQWRRGNGGEGHVAPETGKVYSPLHILK
jgi:hypothetical protein